MTKVFEPSPTWLRLVLKSSIDEPVAALTDVSFTLHPGEACVVVGPNGAGKSTLFKILIGLITPTSGHARVMGVDITEGRRIRSLIGYMPAEDRNLLLRHTCIQNLEFRGRLQGITSNNLSARVNEALEEVGIGHARNRAASSLSTGMRARLQLAAAILHDPKVLILDEPTSAVDPVGAHELLTLIEGLRSSRGLSVVLSSHRLEEIDALDDKVVFLDKGHVLHNGNLGELRRIWETPRYRLVFTPTTDVAAMAGVLSRLPEAVVTPDPETMSVEVSTRRSVGEVMSSLGPAVAALTDLSEVAMPLRELFHKLVTGEIQGYR